MILDATVNAAATDPFVVGGAGAILAIVAGLAVKVFTRGDAQIASVIEEKNALIARQEARLEALEAEADGWRDRYYALLTDRSKEGP